MPDAGRRGGRLRPGRNFRRVAALVQQADAPDEVRAGHESRGLHRWSAAERESNRAKFWLDPVHLCESGGFGAAELNRLWALIVGHEVVLLEAWHEFFGD